MIYYNQLEITHQAIKTLIFSIESDIVKQGVEIILVDNGSDESLDTSIYINHSDINICVYKLESNLGYPVGVNYGISKCSGEVITIINNDLIFTKGWLSPLVKTLFSHSKIGLVGPLLSNASGSQHLGFYSTDLDGIHFKANEIMKLSRDAYETDRLIGACMVFKRAIIDLVGGNDFWFGPGYYDDDDWCLRIRIAGYKILIVKSSFVYHIGSVSFHEENLVASFENNKRKFLKKWNIKCSEERYKVLDRGIYNKEAYYIPIKINEYNNTNNIEKISGVLVVADWSNQASNWIRVINQLIKESSTKYYLWVPSNYFEPINQLTPKNFEFITRPVSHLNLLPFINQFDSILKIEKDFINAYLIEIARCTSTKVISI